MSIAAVHVAVDRSRLKFDDVLAADGIPFFTFFRGFRAVGHAAVDVLLNRAARHRDGILPDNARLIIGTLAHAAVDIVMHRATIDGDCIRSECARSLGPCSVDVVEAAAVHGDCVLRELGGTDARACADKGSADLRVARDGDGIFTCRTVFRKICAVHLAIQLAARNVDAIARDDCLLRFFGAAGSARIEKVAENSANDAVDDTLGDLDRISGSRAFSSIVTADCAAPDFSIDGGCNGIVDESALDIDEVIADRRRAGAARECLNDTLLDGDRIARNRTRTLRPAAVDLSRHCAARDGGGVLLHRPCTRCGCTVEILRRAGLKRQMVVLGICIRRGIAAVCSHPFISNAIELQLFLSVRNRQLVVLHILLEPRGVADIYLIIIGRRPLMDGIRIPIAMELGFDPARFRCIRRDTILVVAALLRLAGKSSVDAKPCVSDGSISIAYQGQIVPAVVLLALRIYPRIADLTAPLLCIERHLTDGDRATKRVAVRECQQRIVTLNPRVKMEIIEVKVSSRLRGNALRTDFQMVLAVTGLIAARERSTREIRRVRLVWITCIVDADIVARRIRTQLLSIAAVDGAIDHTARDVDMVVVRDALTVAAGDCPMNRTVLQIDRAARGTAPRRT